MSMTSGGAKPCAPANPVTEATIPASRAAIEAIASLHALTALDLLDLPDEQLPPFTTLLWTLRRVPGIFEEAYRPYRFRVARAADCLICQARPTPSSREDLDVALDNALARLGNA